jgi:O-antigen ligase
LVTAAVYLVLALNALWSLGWPWVGVIVTYGIILLTPHNIWFWAFEGVQPVQWAILPALAGFGLATLRGAIDFRMLRASTVYMMGVLLFSLTIAYYFGPYVDVVNASRYYDSAVMFDVLVKANLLFFVGVCLIDTPRKLMFATLPLIITVVYMTYWTNAQYFFEGRFGRIGGPTPPNGHSIYFDENIFATLFVVGFPFLISLSRLTGSRVLLLASLSIVPLAWHAAFLTASRGALVGIGVVLLVLTMRSRRKSVGIFIAVAFVAAFYFQGGDTLHERSGTIADLGDEASTNDRFEAWAAATNMIVAHPITGVGLAAFGQAFPYFSDKPPRIAHNTFLQITAEWGVVAGVAYLVLIGGTLLRLMRNGRLLRASSSPESRALEAINEACFLGLTGFVICSLFLSLEKFELFHYLVLLSNSVVILGTRMVGNEVALWDSTGPVKPSLPRLLR